MIINLYIFEKLTFINFLLIITTKTWIVFTDRIPSSNYIKKNMWKLVPFNYSLLKKKAKTWFRTKFNIYKTFYKHLNIFVLESSWSFWKKQCIACRRPEVVMPPWNPLTPYKGLFILVLVFVLLEYFFSTFSDTRTAFSLNSTK